MTRNYFTIKQKQSTFSTPQTSFWFSGPNKALTAKKDNILARYILYTSYSLALGYSAKLHTKSNSARAEFPEKSSLQYMYIYIYMFCT